MNILYKIAYCTLLLLGISFSLMAQENNNLYTELENEGSQYYNYSAPGVAPPYGYGYYGSAPEAPNSQIFPDDTEANTLYWGEVKQMEQGN